MSTTDHRIRQAFDQLAGAALDVASAEEADRADKVARLEAVVADSRNAVDAALADAAVAAAASDAGEPSQDAQEVITTPAGSTGTLDVNQPILGDAGADGDQLGDAPAKDESA